MDAHPETRPATSTTKKAVVCLLVGVLYGFANYLSGRYYVPGSDFAELRPQVAVPMFLGILYGPWAGFVSGGLGDMLGYAMAGRGPLFAPHWSLANGLMGFLPGLAWSWGARPVDSRGAFGKLLVLLLAASSLPFVLAIGVDLLQGDLLFRDAVFQIFLPVFITDTLWAFILVPVMLRFARLLEVRIELRTILMVYYLLIFTVLATWLSSVLITMQDELRIEELYLLGALTLLVLMVGLVISAVLARRITAPVIVLTDVAEKVAAGDYAATPVLEEITPRTDEIGTLAGVFRKMVQAVERREADLQRQLSELRIKIDPEKQETELERITGTEYFKELRRKAGDLRRSVINDDQASP